MLRFLINHLVVSAISTPIGAVIGMLIFGGIFWIVAKILGGKGSYGNYVGTLSLVDAAIMGTASALITVLNILGALGGVGTLAALLQVTGILGFVVALYALYLFVRATQAVHKVSALKAILILVLPIILIMIIFIVILGAAFYAILSSLQGLKVTQ